MTWNLLIKPYRLFPRNPLELVVAELKFHPVLVVPRKVDDFQERVRKTFPRFQRVAGRTVEVKAGGMLEVKESQQFVFSTADELISLSLSDSRLALEHRAHKERAKFQQMFTAALSALTETYGAVTPTRLGLRYINSVRKDKIQLESAKALEWSDLVTAPFLNSLPILASLDDTLFYSEISSTLGVGRLTVRHGIMKTTTDSLPEFRLDLDRYIESDLEIDRVTSHLDSFSSDIYNVFREAAGPELITWMAQGSTS